MSHCNVANDTMPFRPALNSIDVVALIHATSGCVGEGLGRQAAQMDATCKSLGASRSRLLGPGAGKQGLAVLLPVYSTLERAAGCLAVF